MEPKKELVIEHISHRYKRKTVLEDADFSVARGTCVGVIGINGGGKSTLLSILAGVKKPSGGDFVCYGHQMFRERALFPKLIGYLPQQDPLLPDLSARDNLRLFLGKRVTEDLAVLEKLQLKDLLDLKVRSLSGGMKRRLAIACAVCLDQPVLIMDEPSSALDLHQKEIIRRYIREYTEEGGIVLLSTHDPLEIDLCDERYYLENGRTVPVSSDEALERLRKGIE